MPGFDNKLYSTKTPAWPFAPVEYSQQYQDQFSNVMRLYCQTVDNFTSVLMDERGGRFISNPYGSFISTTTQTAAAINTAYPITLSATSGLAENGIYVGSNTASVFPSSRIYALEFGLYNLQFSLQLKNTNTQEQDVNIWLRKNGVNPGVANSNTFVSVVNKHGGIDGHSVAAWNFFVDYTATNDYYELMWSTNSTLVSIPASAAASPAPATPSVILTMQFVSAL